MRSFNVPFVRLVPVRFTKESALRSGAPNIASYAVGKRFSVTILAAR
jgi:hypothetical protein